MLNDANICRCFAIGIEDGERGLLSISCWQTHIILCVLHKYEYRYAVTSIRKHQHQPLPPLLPPPWRGSIKLLKLCSLTCDVLEFPYEAYSLSFSCYYIQLSFYNWLDNILSVWNLKKTSRLYWNLNKIKTSQSSDVNIVFSSVHIDKDEFSAYWLECFNEGYCCDVILEIM